MSMEELGDFDPWAMEAEMEREALAAMEAEESIMNELEESLGANDHVNVAPKRQLAYTPVSATENRLKTKLSMCNEGTAEMEVDGPPVVEDPPTRNEDVHNFSIYRTPPIGIDTIPFTTTDGDRLYVDASCPPTRQNRRHSLGGASANGYLERTIKDMVADNERTARLERLRQENGMGEGSLRNMISREDYRKKNAGKSNSLNRLWVDQYTPRSFAELLSSERVNRQVLGWVKSWDPAVFKREQSKTPHVVKQAFASKEAAGGNDNKGDQSFFKKKTPAKVILLSGPPGAGKTTLAHVAARHAGYNPIEINASDVRTGTTLHRRIIDAMEMQSMFGNKKPNCIILDEIDGAASARGDSKSAIDMLVKMVNATNKAAAGGDGAKKKGKGKSESIITRPIICICNDQYAQVLRPLRGVADSFNFRSTKTERLVKRLKDICRQENIHVPGNVLSVLCNRTDNDIRSCLNTLQFLACQRASITLHDLEGNSVGHKDQKASLFEVWSNVFSKQSTEAFSGLLNESSRILNGIHENYLKMRYTDPNFEKTLEALSWITAGSRARNDGYFEMALRGIRHACRSDLREKVESPRAHAEMSRERARKRNMLAAFCDFNGASWKGVRSVDRLATDVVSYFLDILMPPIRPVSLSLMNAAERTTIQNVVALMMDNNLTYSYRGGDSHSFSKKMVLDPPLHQLTEYEDVPPTTDREKNRRQAFSKDQINTLFREMEKIRLQQRMGHDVDVEEGSGDSTVDAFSKAKKRALPEAKIQSKEKRAKIADDGKHGILFKFTEGFTNAVQRKVYTSEFF